MISKRGFQPVQNPVVFLLRPRAPLCRYAVLWAALLPCGGDQHIFSVGIKTEINECTKEHRADLPLNHELRHFPKHLYRALKTNGAGHGNRNYLVAVIPADRVCSGTLVRHEINDQGMNIQDKLHLLLSLLILSSFDWEIKQQMTALETLQGTLSFQ